MFNFTSSQGSNFVETAILIKEHEEEFQLEATQLQADILQRNPRLVGNCFANRCMQRSNNARSTRKHRQGLLTYKAPRNATTEIIAS